MKKFLLAIAAAVAATGSVQARSVDHDIDGAALTVSIPDTGAVKGAVLILPGGGYSHLAMKHEGTDWAGWFGERGIIAAVLAYPMPEGDSSRPLATVARALDYMRDHAAEWGNETMKTGIMGSSAGGHLASTAATHLPADKRPDFQILFYPVISMDTTITHPGSRRNLLGDNPDEDVVKSFSNATRVDAATPRAFIALSGDDGAVPPANSLQYYDSLLKFNIPASLHIYPTGGHGWGFRPSFKFHDAMLAELDAWIKTL